MHNALRFIGGNAICNSSRAYCGLSDGHAAWGGFPHKVNLCRGQGVGLVDEVAEGALRDQRFGGEGAGGVDGAGVFVAQRVRGWRRTECAGPGQDNSFVLLPLLLSFRRFKCSTATVKVSASDGFSAPFASSSRTPSGNPTVAIWSPLSQKRQE